MCADKDGSVNPECSVKLADFLNHAESSSLEDTFSSFYHGFEAKLYRPTFRVIAVVTSMLALRFLPKNGKDVEENKRVISSLFAHSGPVVKVLLESGDNFAVVVMERRFHAHHAKRRILEGERGSPVDYSADENVLVTLIRSRRVLLQW